MEEKLEAALEHILRIYLKEFSRYMSAERIEYLSDEKNIKDIIKFSENGIGAWCSGFNIMFGSNTNVLIEKYLKSNQNYATNPNAKLVSMDNFIDNEIDYLDYIKYFIVKGGNEFDYFLDMLPHEAMHLIGVGGGVIREGVCERNAREMCLKYGIRSAPILHSKENKLVGLLGKLIDNDLIMKVGFSSKQEPYDMLLKAVRQSLWK